MGLAYPSSMLLKTGYIVGLVLALCSIFYGFKNSKLKVGQMFAVFGIVLWAGMGTLGLGTGT